MEYLHFLLRLITVFRVNLRLIRSPIHRAGSKFKDTSPKVKVPLWLATNLQAFLFCPSLGKTFTLQTTQPTRNRVRISHSAGFSHWCQAMGAFSGGYRSIPINSLASRDRKPEASYKGHSFQENHGRAYHNSLSFFSVGCFSRQSFF